MKEKSGKPILRLKWEEIKKQYKEGTNGNKHYGKNFPIDGPFHMLCLNFVDLTILITERMGMNCIVDGMKLDSWKDRIWNLMENAGLVYDVASNK